MCASHAYMHTCASQCVPVHTMAQWLLQQAAWHWFDIQRHANIMRPGRGQRADADRWPHPLDVRALKHLEKSAYRLLCMTSSSVPSGDWEGAQQWEGSIRLRAADVNVRLSAALRRQ